MNYTLCQYCGWGSQIKPNCLTSTEAISCNMNQENVRKFCLRFKDQPKPSIVRSVRYQDPTKSKWGAYYEFLDIVE